MRKFASGIVAGALGLAFGGSAAVAQELNEVCPDSPDMTGALWGLVSDEDAEMGLPGATVVASWEQDGESGQMEGQTALDGSYTLCYVPLGVDLSVQAMFAGTGGNAMAANLTEQITRLDLGFSLSGVGGGGGGNEDDRIWACLGADDNQINMQNSRLIRCDSDWQELERCPKEEEHGQVQATVTGGGSGTFREALEKVLSDARRLGANALINWRWNRNSLSAEAVTISVSPATCT